MSGPRDPYYTATRCLTYHEVGLAVANLANRLQAVSFDVPFWGIARGGAIIALLLSYYKVHAGRRLIIADAWPEEPCLVIDDICDTGQTLMKHVRSEDITAVLFVRSCRTPMMPHYHVVDLRTKEWIVFPWELEG